MDFRATKIKPLSICLIFLLTTLGACEKNIFDKEEPSFIVNNKSGQKVSRVTIYAQDGDPDNLKMVGERKVVVSFEDIDAENYSDLKTVNLKKISNRGEGNLSVEVIMDSGDTLTTGLGIYKKNRIYTESLPSNWQTIIIEIDSKLVLKAQNARHHNGTFEKYGL